MTQIARQQMTKWHYIIIRVIISIVTVAVFVGLIVKGYGWPPFIVFAAGCAINLWLKHKQKRVTGVVPDYMPPESELDDRRRT
jgi:hypothetical protein